MAGSMGSMGVSEAWQKGKDNVARLFALFQDSIFWNEEWGEFAHDAAMFLSIVFL